MIWTGLKLVESLESLNKPPTSSSPTSSSTEEGAVEMPNEPQIDQKVFDSDGTEWVVYIPKMRVECVRLRRFNKETGGNEYKDIPLTQWNVLP